MRRQAIEPGLAADSVLSILAQLNLERLPSNERLSVASVELEAVEQWLAASLAGVVRQSVYRVAG